MRELKHDEQMQARSLTCNRNEKGYPLLVDGNVDWELTSWEKSRVEEKHERDERGGSSRNPKQKHGTNYTPPKKRNR